jgi:hypothetical protein
MYFTESATDEDQVDTILIKLLRDPTSSAHPAAP